MKQFILRSCLKCAFVLHTSYFMCFPLCATFGKAVKPMGDSRLLFELKLGKNEYDIGERIIVDLILKNVSNSPLCINSRMVINHNSAPSQYREVELFLESKEGNLMDFDCRVNTRRATEKDYRVVQPGESVTRKFEITNCYKIKKTGKYAIRASFQDGTKAIDELCGIPIFLEKVDSNWVSFIIK